MSLQDRLAALISAVGADIKALNNTVPEVYIGANAPDPRGGRVIWVDTDETPSLQGPTFVTSLPASPADGQEVYFLADATYGVVWHLRYRAGSSSAYKWEFVGGPPIFTPTFGGANNTSGAIYQDVGVNLALPLAGDYLAQLIGRIGANNVPAGTRLYTRLTVTSGSISANDMVLIAQGSTSNDATDRNINNTYRIWSASAGALVKAQYGLQGASGTIVVFITTVGIILTPIRVG